MYVYFRPSWVSLEFKLATDTALDTSGGQFDDRKCSTAIVHSRTNLSSIKCCELVLFRLKGCETRNMKICLEHIYGRYSPDTGKALNFHQFPEFTLLLRLNEVKNKIVI